MSRSRRATVRIFVAGHTDELLATVANGDEFTTVDLRSLTLDRPFQGNQFAESRFLLSAEAREVQTDYVGFCGASYDKKFPVIPHLAALPQIARRLRPSIGLGPCLSDKWLAESEHVHPGIGAILDRVATEFGLTMLPRPEPYANTFVCHRDEWLRLLDVFQTMLTAILDWYGPAVPFRYRCLRCGAVSDAGSGRYTSARHMGFLGERLTMLYFSSRADIHFFTPLAYQLRASRLLRPLAPVHSIMKMVGIHALRPGTRSSSFFDGPPCLACGTQ